MSRSIRKNKQGKIVKEGHYKCKCSYCINTSKKKITEKLIEQDMLEAWLYLEDRYSDYDFFEDDYVLDELSTDILIENEK